MKLIATVFCILGSILILWALLRLTHSVSQFHYRSQRYRFKRVTIHMLEEELYSSIWSMMQKTKAFVIVEDTQTGRFLQFCGSIDAKQPLLIDIPLRQFRQCRSSSMGDWNEAMPVTRIKSILMPGYVVDEKFYTIQKGCINIQEATLLALRILREVFLVLESGTVLLTEGE